MIAIVLWLRSVFFSDGTPNFQHDWTWPVLSSQITAFFPDRVEPWRHASLGGYNPDSVSYAPLMVAVLVAYFAGSSATCKILLFLCAALSFSGAAWVASQYVRDRITPFCVGAFYAFGPVAVNKVASGQVNAWAAYACLPWVFGLCASRRLPEWSVLPITALLFAFIASQPHVMLCAGITILLLAFLQHGKKAAYVTGAAWLLGFATQGITLVYLLLSARESAIGQFMARIPWEVQQSPRWSDALILGGYFTRYYELALGRMYPAARCLLYACVVAAIVGLLFLGKRRVAIAASCLVFALLSIVSSFHSALTPIVSDLFLRYPSLSIFRELYNIEEIVAVLFCIGLANAAVNRAARPAINAITFSIAALSVAASFYAVLHSPNLHAHAAAARYLAAEPGSGRIWPLPNGRFIADRLSGDGGFDPFSGQIGGHNMVEEYFPESVIRVAQSRPQEKIVPLLRAMDVEFIWIRRDWVWRPAGGNGTAPYPTECPRGTRVIWDTSSDKICQLSRSNALALGNTLQIVPDLWDFGIGALSSGKDFVFAHDAAWFGIHEMVDSAPDDKSVVNPKLGAIPVELGPSNSSRLSRIAGSASFTTNRAVARAVLSTSPRFATTDGAFALRDAIRMESDTFLVRCNVQNACWPHRATFVAFGGRMQNALTESFQRNLGGSQLLVVRSAYLSSVEATIDGKVLPHVRIDGIENGWIIPRGMGPKVTFRNNDWSRVFLAQATTVLAWILIVASLGVQIARQSFYRSAALASQTRGNADGV